MALASARAVVPRLSGVHVLINKPCWGNNMKMASICPIQVATLKSTHGKSLTRKPPNSFKYNRLLQLLWIDRTSEMFDENSKVIVVDGNVGVGKNEFGKKLAKEFDMKFFPALLDENVYVSEETGLDFRVLDKYLPKEVQTYCIKDLLTDPDPSHGLIGTMQIDLYRQRFHYYREALHHLFQTGQGVVVTRSPYADIVFAEAMKKKGYMTPQAFKFYKEVHRNTICDMLTPHLTVYMDAPVSLCRQRITERGRPEEQNSVALSDEFLETKRDLFLNSFVPKMQKSGEVYELNTAAINIADEHDWEIIIEDLEELVLRKTDPEQTQFDDWNFEELEDWFTFYRRNLGNYHGYNELFALPMPFDAPELMIPEKYQHMYKTLKNMHPCNQYDKNYSPYYNDKWKLLFKL